MKYLLFVTSSYEEVGGWGDFEKAFDNFKDALTYGDAFLINKTHYSWEYHIVNLDKLKVVKRKFVHPDDGLVSCKNGEYVSKANRMICSKCKGSGEYSPQGKWVDLETEILPNGMLCQRKQFIQETIQCEKCKGTGKNV